MAESPGKKHRPARMQTPNACKRGPTEPVLRAMANQGGFKWDSLGETDGPAFREFMALATDKTARIHTHILTWKTKDLVRKLVNQWGADWQTHDGNHKAKKSCCVVRIPSEDSPHVTWELNPLFLLCRTMEEALAAAERASKRTDMAWGASRGMVLYLHEWTYSRPAKGDYLPEATLSCLTLFMLPVVPFIFLYKMYTKKEPLTLMTKGLQTLTHIDAAATYVRNNRKTIVASSSSAISAAASAMVDLDTTSMPEVILSPSSARAPMAGKSPSFLHSAKRPLPPPPPPEDREEEEAEEEEEDPDHYFSLALEAVEKLPDRQDRVDRLEEMARRIEVARQRLRMPNSKLHSSLGGKSPARPASPSPSVDDQIESMKMRLAELKSGAEQQEDMVTAVRALLDEARQWAEDADRLSSMPDVSSTDAGYEVTVMAAAIQLHHTLGTTVESYAHTDSHLMALKDLANMLLVRRIHPDSAERSFLLARLASVYRRYLSDDSVATKCDSCHPTPSKRPKRWLTADQFLGLLPVNAERICVDCQYNQSLTAPPQIAGRSEWEGEEMGYPHDVEMEVVA
jgi:hypothetical protein